MWNLASRYVAATAVLVSAAAAVAVNQRSGEESAMTLKPEVVGKDRDCYAPSDMLSLPYSVSTIGPVLRCSIRPRVEQRQREAIE